MKIKKIEIKNFKFHHELNIDIENNCLIYGENGTGKSSIFEAFYTNLYHKKRLNHIDTLEIYKNRDYLGEDLEVKILFDTQQFLNRTNNILISSNQRSSGLLRIQGDPLEDSNIYCANERIFTRITKEDFYTTIKETLQEHFVELKKLNIFDAFAIMIKRTNQLTPEIREERDTLDKEFEILFKELIPIDKINEIIKNNLNEKFEIEFTITHSENTSTFKEPTIELKIKGIDSNKMLYNHFNEAKLKLISIAIYFALAKKYEIKERDSLNVLILDDFLTSLDMANRKLIIQYILDEFKDYQKIIFTHNLQFFNLIKKFINNDWSIKKLFILRELDGYKSYIKHENDNYIKDAKKFIDTENYNLEIAGNLLRKAFESITQEFEQLCEIGKVEQFKVIISSLKNKDTILYNQPNVKIKKFIQMIRGILNTERNNDEKISTIKNIIEGQLSNYKMEVKCEDSDSIHYSVNKIYLYKNILLNPSSHNDMETEIYLKECQNTILLLEQLEKLLEKIKGTN